MKLEEARALKRYFIEATRSGKLGSPGKLKMAGDMPPFLKQDRPGKVKEIYRALKRDHPEMPAEMKARIASRQGKKGKQHQGPPYKAPITKIASDIGRWLEIAHRYNMQKEAAHFGPARIRRVGKSGARLYRSYQAGKGVKHQYKVEESRSYKSNKPGKLSNF